MATTIKISDEAKAKLERIRARLLLQGKKLRQDELIEFIISLAETSPLILNQKEFKGLTDEQKKIFFSFSFKGGKSDKSIEIYLHDDSN